MHYSIHNSIRSFEDLKSIFPEPEANEMNFVLFSTSGVHGSYQTIEEAHEEYTKFLNDPAYDTDDGNNEVTVLVVHPRLVCMKYGNILVTDENVEYLKALRQSSWAVVQKIGAP